MIDTGYEQNDIRAAIRRAVSKAFRDGLRGMDNPFGTGDAGRIITERLKTVALTDDLVIKRFADGATV